MSDQTMAACFATALLDCAMAEGAPRGRWLAASGLPSGAEPWQAQHLAGTGMKD